MTLHHLPVAENSEALRYNPERRYLDDSATLFAETLDGIMYTPIWLRFDGQELYGQDGRAMGKIVQDAEEAAKQIAKYEPKLAFEIKRRRTETEEYKMMLAMAKGEGPNTMIVVSDMPKALQNATMDIGGYKIDRQLAYLRVITRQPNGNLFLQSQSLDLSDRDGLEAIYYHFGEKPHFGELLGQRILRDLSAQQQQDLLPILVDTYDETLAENYGGEWQAGRDTVDLRNTWDFVKTQHDLLRAFVNLQLTNPELAEKMRFSFAAAFEARWEKRNIDYGSHIHGVEYHANLIAYEVIQAGALAQSEGKTYSACGLTMTADGNENLEDLLKTAGYGNGCVEVKNGQWVKCPDCNKQVQAIVPDRKTIFCSNPGCKSAHPSVKKG